MAERSTGKDVSDAEEEEYAFAAEMMLRHHRLA